MIDDYERKGVIMMPTVYPGHPCLLAMQIMVTFPTYAQADAKTERGWAEALSSSNVRGSGGAVSQALEVVREIEQNPLGPEAAFDLGCSMWEQSRKSDHADKFKEGVARSIGARGHFLSLARRWLNEQNNMKVLQDARQTTKDD